MKSTLTLLIALLISLSSFAQGYGINYKAVIKDDSGNILTNQNLKVKFAIVDLSDNIDYGETHTTTTDTNGIVILIIGDGTEDVIGDYYDLDWANGFYRLRVEIDIAPYDTFVTLGTTPFQAVPLALNSLDNLWQFNNDNAIALGEKVGIGTDTPSELLHIYDGDKAAINLEVPSYSDESQIEFRNGLETGFHSFYKILNRSDLLRFELDTDITATAGYESKMTLSSSGLALENGSRINEFSIDGTLSGNSHNTVPTEAAVKAYVDNRGQSNYWRRTSLSSNPLLTATSTYQPIGPALTIDKEFSDSNIEVTVNSRINGGIFSSTSVLGVSFIIRIDGIDATFDNKGAINTTNTMDFISMFAVFQGLSIGSHSIQIYAKSDIGGTSSNVRIDPGNWGGAIIAKETF